MSEPGVVLDPDIDGLANRLRRLFTEAKTEQMGRKYRMTERYRRIEIWYGVARRCIELNADPEDFMDAAFTMCSIPGGPYPQNLATRAVDRWYAEYSKTAAAAMELKPGQTVYSVKLYRRLQSCFMHAVRISAVNRRRLREILLDDSMLSQDLCPAYVRVLMLPLDQGILAKWGAKARSEVLSNPRLLKTLNSLKFNVDWL